MSLTISRTRSEWIVSKASDISSIAVCVAVENGTPRRAQINGLKDDPLYIDPGNLEPLWGALTQVLQEIRASIERTKLPGEN